MRPELFAEEGTLKGLVLVLEEGTEWVIGRDPDLCGLILEDPAASRMHARIKKKDNEFFIENLSETNPLELNDHPVSTKVLLQDGDKVKIGGTVFYFYPEGAPLGVKEEGEEEFIEEEPSYETIYKYEEETPAEIHIDLTTPARFVLKVISGPNSGAEFALFEKKSYLLGTDAATCDIVFYDLSVSRQHASLEVSAEQEIFIEDLGSRNGVIVDRQRIETKTQLSPSQVVILGTSAFLVVDREAPVKTIVAPAFEMPQEQVEKEPEKEKKEKAEELAAKEEEKEEVIAVKEKSKKPLVSGGTVILTLLLAGLIALIGFGAASLFTSSKEIVPVKRDYQQELSNALHPFPGVKFSYNPLSCRLFLVGHVLTGVEKNELFYNLRGLSFIKGVDDNVVIDECIWQEMNMLLGKNAMWKGVSMHSPEPGVFVLTGYLQTPKQAASLVDYMNLNFPYVDRLKTFVIVEEDVIDEVHNMLIQNGFTGVTTAFTNGELTLTGYINSSSADLYYHLLEKLQIIPGVRQVKSYVVFLSPEKGVMDLNEKYPARFKVTGYATHCNVNINVVINGKIYSRGDLLEGGYRITSIQQNTIYLEKEGLKYKIEYNK